MASDEPADALDKNASELYRLRLQMETALLVWVRTSLSLMGFGFVVARFGLFLREIGSVGHLHLKPHPRLATLSSLTGTGMIVLGVVVLLISSWAHFRTVTRLQRGELEMPSRWSMGIVISIILVAVGMALAGYLAAIEIDPGVDDGAP